MSAERLICVFTDRPVSGWWVIFFWASGADRSILQIQSKVKNPVGVASTPRLCKMIVLSVNARTEVGPSVAGVRWLSLWKAY